MTPKRTVQITIALPGLSISQQERGAWEKTVKDMAAIADSLHGLDPMAEEPMHIFDPRIKTR